MRLTVLNQFYTPDISPTAHLSASLAEHRAAKGDEVTVVASQGGYVAASAVEKRREREANPRVCRVWTPRLGKGNAIKRCIDYATFYVGAAWRLLTLPAQDVIVSLTTPPFIAWAALLHKMVHPRAKVVLWSMDCYPEAAERTGVLSERGVPSRVMRFFNRAMVRRIDHLVSLDTAMEELLLTQYNPADRAVPATVIPNWEKASFFPRDSKAAPWRKIDALGLRGKFIVLYLGNTGFGHQFETAIDAADRLRDEPVVFLFVGGGSRWEEIRRLAAQRQLSNVVLHGYVPKEETPSVLAVADAALITLRDVVVGVMSPSKLHANLAAGLPVIYVGPQMSNVDDAIRGFGCGVSLRHGDGAGLAAHVRALMGDANRHGELRRKAREAFEAAYCDERTLPRFDAILDGLAARGSNPAWTGAHEPTASARRSDAVGTGEPRFGAAGIAPAAREASEAA